MWNGNYSALKSHYNNGIFTVKQSPSLVTSMLLLKSRSMDSLM